MPDARLEKCRQAYRDDPVTEANCPDCADNPDCDGGPFCGCTCHDPRPRG